MEIAGFTAVKKRKETPFENGESSENRRRLVLFTHLYFKRGDIFDTDHRVKE